MAEQPDYDVAVVGAGLVGGAAALALGGTGRRVALIDREAPWARPGRLGFGLRTVALTEASLALVGGRGDAAPIRRMRVWEECGTGCIEFGADAVDAAALAWVVEAGAARAALWQECAAHPNVHVVVGAVAGLAEADERLRLELGGHGATQPSALAARLVIAADGASSELCGLAGVKALPRGQGDAAIATVARFEAPHQGTALQRFGTGGPLALLPLKDPHTVSVIWSLDRHAAERLATLPDAAFVQALEAAAEGALGSVRDIDQRVSAPLAQQVVANCNPRPRLLALGDAARTVYPLAGQGVNLGLEDVARVLAKAGNRERDLGRPNLWRGFAARRRLRGEGMAALMRALRATYGHPGPVARWARNIGVRWLDHSALVKRQLILEAMGTGPLAAHL